MASSFYKVKVVDASGNAQIGTTVAAYLKVGSNWGNPAADIVSTDPNGVADLEIAVSGLFKIVIGLNVLENIAILNGTDVDNVVMLEGSGITEADLTKLHSVTASAVDLNKIDVTAGTVKDSKAIVVNSASGLTGGTLNFNGVQWQIGGTPVDSTAADLNLVQGLAASGKTLATTDQLGASGGGGGGGGGSDYRTINLDISSIAFVSGTYKTVFLGTVRGLGGDFKLDGILLRTEQGTPSQITKIKVNKQSPAGVSTQIFEEDSITWTTMGTVGGSVADLLTTGSSGTISSSNFIEVEVETTTATALATTQIELNFKGLGSTSIMPTLSL